MVPSGSPIDPWNAAGGFIVTKTSFDRSVLSPPIYDTAPLTIPALAPGQAVILEIPWYPPRPARLHLPRRHERHSACWAASRRSRRPKATNVTTNVRNGNNLAWRNIQVLDDFTGTMAAMSMMVGERHRCADRRNCRCSSAKAAAVRAARAFVEAIDVGMPPELSRRIERAGRGQRGAARRRASNASRRCRACRRTPCSCRLRSEDRVARHRAEAGRTIPAARRVPTASRLQADEGAAVVRRRAAAHGREARWSSVACGLQLDVSHMTWSRHAASGVMRSGDMALPTGPSPRFDDTTWQEAPAPLGFAPALEAMTGVEPRARRSRISASASTCRIPRHGARSDVAPAADDGAVVYLNGREVHRANIDKQVRVIKARLGDGRGGTRVLPGAAAAGRAARRQQRAGGRSASGRDDDARTT